MCLESDPGWSKARSPDGPCLDRTCAPSVVSEESPMVGTRSSRRDVAASSLPRMVSASFAGSMGGIFRGGMWVTRDGMGGLARWRQSDGK